MTPLLKNIIEHVKNITKINNNVWMQACVKQFKKKGWIGIMYNPKGNAKNDPLFELNMKVVNKNLFVSYKYPN